MNTSLMSIGEGLAPLDSVSVGHISSGQVIPDLRACVKELIDNALDAGATTIKIVLGDSGASFIEVWDNGQGMDESQLLNGCGRRHHTSKISCLEDVTAALPSIGFRGEALNSLAAVADLSITSRYRQASCALVVELDQQGVPRSLGRKDYVAREVGTTVTVKNLFCRYPVRRKSFISHSKNHVLSLLKLLTAYACIRSNVRFSVVVTRSNTQQTKTLLSTRGDKKSLRESVGELFGQSLSEEMVEIQVDRPIEGWKLTALLLPPSSCRNKQQRLALCFLNGRPVTAGLRRLINALYSVYKQLSSGNAPPQYVLSLEIKADIVDLNLTPNKQYADIASVPLLLCLKAAFLQWFRSLFLKHDVHIAEAFAAEVQKAFQSFVPSISKETFSVSQSQPLDVLLTQNVSTPLASTSSRRDVQDVSTTTPTSGSSLESQKPQCKRRRLYEYTVKNVSDPNEMGSNATELDHGNINEGEAGTCDSTSFTEKHLPLANSIYKVTAIWEPPSLASSASDRKSSSDELPISTLPLSTTNSENPQTDEESEPNRLEDLFSTFLETGSAESLFPDHRFPYATFTSLPSRAMLSWENVDSERSLAYEHDALTPVPYSQGDTYALKLEDQEDFSTSTKTSSSITFPKEYFTNMRVIGQFNRGFIIAALRTFHFEGSATKTLQDELFIIDQHAADEKHKFETLCSRWEASASQPLVYPIRPVLAPEEKQIVLNHLDVFRLNGFHIEAPSATTTASQKTVNGASPHDEIAILAVPQIGSRTLTVDDFYEVVGLLLEAQQSLTNEDDESSRSCSFHGSAAYTLSSASHDTVKLWTRPSKIRDILASRACRSAVMIGDPLTHHQMYAIMHRMASLHQPWNCPHGRPTMRHLATLTITQAAPHPST